MRRILGPFTLLLASALGHEVAHAEEPEDAGEPRILNVSGL